MTKSKKKRIDPLDCNVPNINFSLKKVVSNKKDRRYNKWKEQRITRGFDDTETWELYMTIAKFILPRLKAFRKDTYSTPVTVDCTAVFTDKEWDDVLDKMIYAFTTIVRDDDYDSTTFHIEYNKQKEGLALFSEHFLSLWD
jgi:hypothetical protein